LFRRLCRNLDFNPDNEADADLSDVNGSSSDESSDKDEEDKESKDEGMGHEIESEAGDTETENLSRAPGNVETDTALIEEAHPVQVSMTSQEPPPILNDEGNGNLMPDVVGDDRGAEWTVELESAIGARRSAGRIWKRTEVDSRCECDTLITSEEKEAGTRVMECKARGCETGWVHGICFHFHPNLPFN
jgi:hypothetical protein